MEMIYHMLLGAVIGFSWAVIFFNNDRPRERWVAKSKYVVEGVDDDGDGLRHETIVFENQHLNLPEAKPPVQRKPDPQKTDWDAEFKKIRGNK